VSLRPHAALAYIGPFVAYVALLGLEHAAGWPPHVFYPVQFLVVGLILVGISRPFVPLRPSFPLASAGIGALVFLVWIAPDVLFGYRHHWLFDNPLTGSAVSSIAPAARRSMAFALLRATSSTALVPVLEELFWRGWLMRWLIDVDFQKVPIGTYAPRAFWLVVVLFASEHGSYWEVGLAAGIAFNWWIVRTRNLADCILAHAVTNALLSAYVLIGNHWQYWL